MTTVKILKRKDAASVLVAIVLALIVSGAVESWSARPAEWLSGVSSAGGGWRAGVWEPLLRLIVELIVLEIVVRVYISLNTSQQGKK